MFDLFVLSGVVMCFAFGCGFEAWVGCFGSVGVCWGLFGRLWDLGCCLCFRVCSFRTCAVGCSGVVVVRGFGAWVGRVGCWVVGFVLVGFGVVGFGFDVFGCCGVDGGLGCSGGVWLLLFVLSGVFVSNLCGWFFGCVLGLRVVWCGWCLSIRWGLFGMFDLFVLSGLFVSR
jgi:hypothetical protein